MTSLLLKFQKTLSTIWGCSKYSFGQTFASSNPITARGPHPFFSLFPEVTEVESSFLLESKSPLLEISQPLQDPAPCYSRKVDQVLAWHDVTFGRHAWLMPRLRELHPDAEIRCQVFAAALLAGDVMSGFKGDKYLSQANTLSCFSKAKC